MFSPDLDQKYPDFLLAPILPFLVDEELLPLFEFTENGLKANFRTTKAAIYGGEDTELFADLHAYRAFPGSFDCFNMKLHPYSRQLKQYKSMKKNELMYKQDILGEMHATMPLSDLGLPANAFIRDVVGFYLRTKELRLNGICEIVPIDREEFEEYKDGVHHKLGNTPLATHMHRLANNTLEEVFEILKKFLPVYSRDPEYLTVKAMLVNFESKKPLKRNKRLFLNILDWLAITFSEMELFIECNPQYFLPISELADKGYKLPIRLFIDDDNKFVFAKEVLAALEDREIDVESVKKKLTSSNVLHTISFDDLREMMEKEIMVLEFVPTKIHRSTFFSIYVPTFNGKYGILTVDFVMALFRYLISVKSLFYNMDQENWKKLLVIFMSIDDIFDLNVKTPQFIDVEEIRRIMAVFRDYVNTTFADLLKKTTKKVRPVGPKGFTLKEFKAEIEHLGLNNFFKHGDLFDPHVYSMISQKKVGSVLRTCDLYEGLEIVQLWGLLALMKHQYSWFQVQGFCHSFPLMCFWCRSSNSMCTWRKKKTIKFKTADY